MEDEAGKGIKICKQSDWWDDICWWKEWNSFWRWCVNSWGIGREKKCRRGGTSWASRPKKMEKLVEQSWDWQVGQAGVWVSAWLKLWKQTKLSVIITTIVPPVVQTGIHNLCWSLGQSSWCPVLHGLGWAWNGVCGYRRENSTLFKSLRCFGEHR